MRAWEPDDLGRFQRREPIQARPVGIIERTVKFARRRPAVASSIGVFVLLSSFIIGMWIQYNIRLQSELDRTNRLFSRAHHLANWLLFDHINAVSKLRGSTPAEKELVQQMLVYLDALAKERREGELVAADIMEADLALAYERIAGVQGDPNQHNMGEPLEALKSYRKALEIRKRRATAHPDDLATQLAHIAVLVKIADINASLGSLQQASTEYQDAEKLLQKLRTLFPQHNDVLVAQSDLQFRLGDVHFEQNKLNDALTAFNAATKIVEEVNGRQPNDASHQRRLAVIHSRIARVLQAQANLGEARKHFDVMLTYAKAVTAAAPLDAEAERDLTVALVGYGDLLFNEQKFAEAHTSYKEAVQFRRTHREADPQSASVARDLAVALERLGTSEQFLNRFPEAETIFREALTILKNLRRDEPENNGLLRDVCLLHDRLGSVLQMQQKAQDANEILRSGLDEGRQLLAIAEPSPADLEVMAQLNATWAGVQVMLLSDEDSDEQFERRFVEAIDGYTRSLDIFQRMIELAPLTPRQQELRDKVEKARSQLQQNLERLRALPKNTSNLDLSRVSELCLST